MKTIVLLSIVVTAVVFGSLACEGPGNTANSNLRSNANSNTSTTGNAMNTVSNTASNAVNAVSNAISSATTSKPEDFMNEAAQGGMAEVEMGKLAGAKSQNAEVKKFGQMMVTDHTAANNELKALAKKKGFTLPTDIGSHKSTMDKLSGLSGAEFDKAYVDEMVDDHETDVAAFQKQADNSTDPEVKAFAAKTLTVVKKHLDAIKAIQAKMNK